MLTETYGEEFTKYYLQYEEEYKNKLREFNPNTRLVKARDVLREHIKSWSDVGMPFMVFKDVVNRDHRHKDLGIIRSANLCCVTGDTRVLTKEYGYAHIGGLVESGIFKATCWNGHEWSVTDLFKTHYFQKVLEVTIDNGSVITATPYHDWYVQDGYGSKPRKVKTKDLKPGMKLIKFGLDTVNHGFNKLPFAYENGLFTADGCEYFKNKYDVNTRECILHLYNEKISLSGLLRNVFRYGKIKPSNVNSIRQTLYLNRDTILPKFFIPDSSYCLQDRLDWFAGLMDGDGVLLNNNGAQSLQITSTNKYFIDNLMLMLQELGVYSRVKKMLDGSFKPMPTNDGTGGYKNYYCNTSYRLCIPGNSCNKLLELGYKANRVMPVKHSYNREAVAFNKIVSVIDQNLYAPTYCGNEPLRHTLMFNGVLTGNCEIVQPTSSAYTGVCNLGSLNLARLESDEELIKITKLANRIMDNCIDLTPYPSEQSRRFQEERRSVGLGALGEAEAIANKQIYFGSEEHADYLNHTWGLISKTMHESSQDLAKEKGECKSGKGYRNCYLMAIAPNSSSAIMAGTTNGLEPVYNTIWLEENKRGSYLMTAPHININNMAYYKNPYEIDMFKQLDMCAIRQKYIDMAMSINLFLDPEGLSIKKVRDLVVHAWKNNLKTLYYLRSKPPKTKGATNDNGISCIGCAN